MRKLAMLCVFLGAMSILSGCLTPSLESDGFNPKIQRYLAYNVWYEKPKSVWSTNYKRGRVIHAGTPVTDVRVGTLRGHSILAFKVPSMGNAEFMLHYVARHHGALTFSAFKNRLFTTEDFATLTKGLSKAEIEAIKSPRPYICKGMTKKAAIMSWGYPPEVDTPSTKLNTWKYWIHRYRTVLVYFDKNGKATAEVQPL